MRFVIIWNLCIFAAGFIEFLILDDESNSRYGNIFRQTGERWRAIGA
jgi:hypothetical protein